MSVFQSITGLNGLSKDIAFGRKWKIAVWSNFQLISKEIQIFKSSKI